MVWAVKSYKVLANIDKNSMDFIEYSNTHEPETSAGAKSGGTPQVELHRGMIT